MKTASMDRLASRIQEKRAGYGIRQAAQEIGISAATLSRVENSKIPDLGTFEKICRWLGDDPATYFEPSRGKASAVKAQVHFKKGAAIEPDSAAALARMILLVHQSFENEEAL